jgi:hypothetical protein
MHSRNTARPGPFTPAGSQKPGAPFMRSHRMTGYSREGANHFPSPSQLHLTKPPADPRTRQRDHNQRQRIPMRPKRRPLVPRNCSAGNTRKKTDDTNPHGMPHRPVRSKPRRNIAAHDGKHNAIRRRQHQRPIAQWLPQRRKHTHLMQHRVGDQRQDKDHDNSGDHGPNASTHTSRRAQNSLPLIIGP